MSKQKKSPKKFLFREGEKKVFVDNSGLEVWIYDNFLKETLKNSGALNFDSISVNDSYREVSRKGLLVGYSLIQDDEICATVIIGEKLTENELSVARWLKPQTAFLSLPSGKLCIESNDASRIGVTEPYVKGASIKVPPGDYKLTLYRIDYEAFAREEIEWDGPSEVILLTPGGTADDSVEDLLPFEENRDLSFIDSYTVNENHTDALVWFDDGWDTFTINLDKKALNKMGVSIGSYLSIHVPLAKIDLVVVYAEEWSKAAKISPPENTSLEEYGYASLCPRQDWDGYEMLFCRRVKANKEIPSKFVTTWSKATVRILDSKPKEIAPPLKGGEILATSKRAYRETKIVECDKFEPGFLSIVLSDLFPSLEDKDDVTIEDAIKTADKAMKAVGFSPVGDVVYEEAGALGSFNCTCRLYSGEEAFGVIRLTDGSFELMFISELPNQSWVVSGMIDALEHQIRKYGNTSNIRLNPVDEKLASVFKSHKKEIKSSSPNPIPNTLTDLVERMEMFFQNALN